MQEDYDWTSHYTGESLAQTADRLRRESRDHNPIIKRLASSRRPGTVKQDSRRTASGTDNTTAGGSTMPTVKQAGSKTATTKPAAKRKPSGSSANKAALKAKKKEDSINDTPLVLAFPPDEHKPDTKPGEKTGALRFAEIGVVDDEAGVQEYPTDDKGRVTGAIVGTLYIRKEQAVANWGQLPTGFTVTLTPTFD